MKAMAGVGVPPQLPTVVTAADGVTRCRWATETGRDLTAYHDDEWGRPTHDETALFEALATPAPPVPAVARLGIERASRTA